MRKTKIICTMGPAVDTDDKIRELILAGMDAARFNFSHGTHEDHRVRMERVRRIAKELNTEIAIILDTKGPEIRVRDFKDGSVILEEGQEFTLYSDESILGDQNGVAISYPYLSEDVEKGNQILIDDGLVSMSVKEIRDGNIICSVENPGKISNHKSINIPGVDVDQVYISETDRSDILFGIEMGVDFIAASFVRSQEDVKKLKKLLVANGGQDIKIIAKIENKSGVDNLEEILKIADGAMVARGDMGVEIPFDQLPAIQKKIIRTCYQRGKIVVTATQMLDSMQEHPRPTRAEVSDVANAIYDGTTATMLSGETAAGKYPIEAVRTMAKIAEYTENQIDYQKRFNSYQLKLESDILNTIAAASVDATFFLKAKAIIACTVSGKTAHVASYYRPAVPIIACCTEEKATRQLKLDYGVYPFTANLTTNKEKVKRQAMDIAIESGIVKKGDLVAFITGTLTGANTAADTLVITRA